MSNSGNNHDLGQLAQIRSFQGTIALVGTPIDQAAKTALDLISAGPASETGQHAATPSFRYKPPYHVTLFSKEELARLGKEKVLKALDAPGVSISTSEPKSELRHNAPLSSQVQPPFQHVFHALGVGASQKKGIYFVVVVWAGGQRLRKQFGLGPKEFHITLSESDEHYSSLDIPNGSQPKGFSRGLDSIFLWFPGLGPLARIVDSNLPQDVSGDQDLRATNELLDHLSFTLHLFGHSDFAQRCSLQLIRQTPSSPRGFLRYADSALSAQRFKLAMLAYACAYERAYYPSRFLAQGPHGETIEDEADQEVTKITQYALKRLFVCARNTEWGVIFLEHEMRQWEDDVEAFDFGVARLFTEPWSKELKKAVGDAVKENPPTLQLEPRESLYIPLFNRATTYLPQMRINTKSLSGSTPTSRDFTFFKLPRFFRWLVPFYLAIMSTPRHDHDIKALHSSALGIRHVLTLTEETPLSPSWFSSTNPSNLPPVVSALARSTGIANTYLPVPNYHPPSIEQMDLVVNLFNQESNVPLLVHCGGGKGRAGTVAACYLVAFGFGKPPSSLDFNDEESMQPKHSAPEAISILRSLRPGSIETSQQETFVSKWCSTVWKRRSIYPSLPAEPSPCPLEIQSAPGETFTPKSHDLLVLVGLPGSGKSFFSQSLFTRNPNRWIQISQDDSGSRDSCETQIGHSPVSSSGNPNLTKKVILDRCNTSSKDRKRWLSLASNWVKSPICIYFDYPTELCESRAQMRAGHPTLTPGSRVRNAIKQMLETLEPPTVEEGFKCVVAVKSFQACEELIGRLTASGEKDGLVKFVRTPHLMDLGAVGDDDIVVGERGGNGPSISALIASASQTSATPPNSRTRIVITEKIDGANLGFSLAPSSSGGPPEIQVQNRSHYVNHLTHAQFKPLANWMPAHTGDLMSILYRDPYYPQRYILYGEWMHATHSIAYTHLPDLFMAFDLYDRARNSFVDRATLERILDGTSIQLVPVIYQGTLGVDKDIPSEDDLKRMVQGQSRFWDGRMEGVYVKIEREGWVVERGKVVRGDFIAGNEHWSKGIMKMNGQTRADYSLSIN
ncbi:hypothetical protein BDN72DRAFT_843206 [Pluteus cervinus]|uniref:Uncharacterized protein n=1 Tax=Pluteus cervinus TaxID=181527 RepID=A0ACD3ANS2_9AGAR|nr:hypothetical protein BDN72DRAFT_843206 [Pluteus cervinus]